MRKWLKKIRTEKEMSMAVAAKAIGISESYYCQIENGIRNVPVPTAKRIAAALGFDWQAFYSEDEPIITCSAS